MNNWHVATAAEAIVAAQFARCGWDVSVQYGANQPEYDLVAVQGAHVLKVSVKGSKDGSWGLTQSLLKQANYHDAADRWLSRHRPGTVICFVQFKGVAGDSMPRIYIATPADVVRRLKETAKGRGDTILYERHTWGSRALAFGTSEEIPIDWRFSSARLLFLASGKAMEEPT